MTLSKFGARITRGSGILDLMHDLGSALAGPGRMLMLGGGNPSHIPEVEALLRARLERIAGDPRAFGRLVGDYSPPQGDPDFIAALAQLLGARCGWDLGPEHIALTTGSQASFHALFNLYAGPCEDGVHRRILLPMAPEYIGYGDVALHPGSLVAVRPRIEELPGNEFKYHVDLDRLAQVTDVGALCVSRPTNPTGNVLSDTELAHLRAHARERGVPLIVDGAYGLPFPAITFSEATPMWDEDMILCLSLSKLGMPAARTGIVIAAPEVIKAVAAMNAVLSLAPGSFGPMLARDLVESGEILEVSESIIRPYYRRRAEQALAWLHEVFAGLPYRVHRSEGAIFLWLWFPGIPMSSADLYARLKARGVLVVPGHHFFPGFDEPWRHRHECIRITYSQEPECVREGLRVIAEEVAAAFGAGEARA